MAEAHARLLVTRPGEAPRVLAERVVVARSAWLRTRGLMFASDFPKGSGLWIEPCSSIHMFFVRFPIDVAFLDARGRVLRTYEPIKPWRISRWVPRARVAVELPSGTLRSVGVLPGDHLRLDPA